MPTYIRWREPGATYFFTVVTKDRRSILTTPIARRLLHEAFERVRSRLPFEMRASVLLPDHLHCLWTLPPNDDDFPQRWSRVKATFTREFLRSGGTEAAVTADHRRQRRRGVWQPRYWEHLIRDEEDYVQHRDYIHLNPVKHGLVKTPEAWPWSSVQEHLRRGELAPDWWNTTHIVLPDARE